jgi:hypothetical protein
MAAGADRPMFNYTSFEYIPVRSENGFHYSNKSRSMELIPGAHSVSRMRLTVWKRNNMMVDVVRSTDMMEFESCFALLVSERYGDNNAVWYSLKAICSGGIFMSRPRAGASPATMYEDMETRSLLRSWSDVKMRAEHIIDVEEADCDGFVAALEPWAAHHGIRVVHDY